MPVVSGDLSLVTARPESVSEVWVRAPRGRVAGSYVFAQAYASTTSGESSWWPADTGPELTELSVRQLSVLQ